MKKYIELTEEQKVEFKRLCIIHYGSILVKCETGEPLYFDEQGNMIDNQIIIDLIFTSNLN